MNSSRMPLSPAERSRNYRQKKGMSCDPAAGGEPPVAPPAVPSVPLGAGGVKRVREEIKYPEISVVHREGKTIITIIIRD